MSQGSEAHHAEAYDRFSLWCATPLGGRLLDAEYLALHGLANGLRGNYIVQLGRLAGRDLVSASGRGKSTILLLSSAEKGNPGADGALHCTPDCLPLACDSVDTVLAPHYLEFTITPPHQLLAEMARVILPGGHLVITGFNPISLWGLARLFYLHKGRMPWQGRCLSSWRVRRYLWRLNFDVLATRYAYYRLPLPSQRLYQQTAALETIGRLCWSPCAAVHLVLAQKRTLPVTPLRMRWSARQRKVVTGEAVGLPYSQTAP